MNLVELIRKNDPNVRIEVWRPSSGGWLAHEEPVKLFSKITCDRTVIRGLTLQPGMRVVVKRAAKYWPNFAQGKGVFWLRSNDSRQPYMTIGWGNGSVEALDGQAHHAASTELSQVHVSGTREENADLILTVPLQESASLCLGIHRVLHRNQLYVHCRGQGVEIGPGPKPQIISNSITRVKYIEQATPDQWQRLYGKQKITVDPSLWQHYVVGNADNIPANPNTLDFIFSSHLVEHLANPLGHLAYWAGLLKANGVVAAVIPDKGGCKDYVFAPSSVDDLVSEYRHGAMHPTLMHYRRWAEVRKPKSDPAEIMKSGVSIHVHFYTPESMDEILSRMYKVIGYRKYSIMHEHNHKDFFVMLHK